MDRTGLGDRMKMYEKRASLRALPCVPVIARIDGKCFSKWVKRLDLGPFDDLLSSIMDHTAQTLVAQTGARIGYTQSDEITLVYYAPDARSQIYCDGKISKMTSILASMATAAFNVRASKAWPRQQPALFDARVWDVPNEDEAANAVLWRELDATRNSLSVLAQSHFPHSQLQGKNAQALHEMLHGIGVNWNNLSVRDKRGEYFRKDGPVNLPPLRQIANRPEVLLNGADPILHARP